jgi:adenylate kinase
MVILGPPASGKGTAAAALSARLEVPHVSTGRMFREAILQGGPVGETIRQFIDKGQLVPDAITMQIVQQWLDSRANASGFILDGFPRTLPQAQAFDQLLAERRQPLRWVVLLELSQELIRQRMLGRLGCERCGRLYHVQFLPPRQPGQCDQCGGVLVRRADDTLETLERRLKVYETLTMPVADHYTRSGLLHRVDASRLAETGFAALWQVVES